MKRWLCVCVSLLLGGMLAACGNQETSESVQESVPQTGSHVEASESTPVESTEDDVKNELSEVQEESTMKVTIGDTVFIATLADNSSAQALKELLAEGPLIINMSDYGNMEKVGPIGQSLPENNEQITTEAGDIILYLGNSLVIYYNTNSWNFTRIGKINDVTQEELKAALGSGNVTVTFELEED